MRMIENLYRVSNDKIRNLEKGRSLDREASKKADALTGKIFKQML